MSYINRYDAINEVLTLRDYCINDDERFAFSLAYKKLREVPTADVVEVVRCKDCISEQHCKFAQHQGREGFCSYGERKQDNG